MDLNGDFDAESALDREAWQVLLRALCGRYSPEGAEPKAFAGSVRPARLCGFDAGDLSCNAHRIERTRGDARLDGTDHYGAIFQFAGRSTLVQDDRVVELAVGDLALVDATRPVTYIFENRHCRWLGLSLPRRSVVSHLGLTEPWETYAALQYLGSAVWLDKYEMFALTRYDSVIRALKDARAFSSASGVMMNDPMNKVLRGNTLCSDGEEHQRLRRITAKPLTPTALNALRVDIAAKAEQIVDRLVAEGSFCAVTELAAAHRHCRQRGRASPGGPRAHAGLGRADVQLLWSVERARQQRLSGA